MIYTHPRDYNWWPHALASNKEKNCIPKMHSEGEIICHGVLLFDLCHKLSRQDTYKCLTLEKGAKDTAKVKPRYGKVN
jgi:hypothetical protein